MFFSFGRLIIMSLYLAPFIIFFYFLVKGAVKSALKDLENEGFFDDIEILKKD